MSARARRGLALSWSALFVCSLVLQYMAFAAAPAALAVHDEGLFELDGNAVDQAAAGDDWDVVRAGTSSAFQEQFIVDAVNSTPDEHLFQGGGSKDGLAISGWKWTTGSGVQDKNDIEHAYAAAYTVASGPRAGNTVVYFGQDRYAQSGDAFVGFWFFKGSVGEAAGGAFSGAHQVGDILVQVNFTNGGAIQDFDISEWNGSGLTSVATGVECTAGVTNDDACGKVNGAGIGEIASPWSYTPKSGTANKIPEGGFFEAGIDLTELGLDSGCFSTFMAETRSSQSLTSTLSDYALGSFSFCAGADIATQVKKGGSSTGNNGHITIGESVTDTATVSGNKGTATGTIDFFVCGPSASAPDCSANGTKVGATKSLVSGSATSDVFTPTAVGAYCFRAEYTPAAGSKYLAGSHTNTTSECFVVDKKQPSIATSANQSVSIGTAISDSGTLSGATSDAGGTIVFKAYGPGDTNCSNAAAFTSSPFAVNGNNTYGPASFTPSTAGTYRWIASYSGDAKNLAATGQCNDEGETDTVTKVNPTIATQASASVVVGGMISDTATVSGGHSPTGTVTFVLYGPGDTTCQTPIFTSANRPLSGGTATSAEYTTSAAGTYRWIATYNGDANNNTVSGACNDANESVIVTKKTPSISTSLVGGGESGASITVPLGTAVHDTSTLTGATATAGGTVHYQVFTNSQCTTLLSDAGTANVVNAVPGNSINITFNHAGTYYWQADYSGDANNESATSSCNQEIVTVEQNIPAITTTASAGVLVGNDIHDTAHLTGGFNPTGTITFRLYGPNDATCVNPAIFTNVKAVNGNGDYVSDNYTANTAGTYRWVASYSGDDDNAAASGACNDANETVIVSPRTPSVTTNASASVEVGGAIFDTAHLAGGFNPTGSITFRLYGPNDATCANPAIFTSAKTVSGNGDYISDSFTTTQAGTYRWIANYGGDTNNSATANGCNGANESVIVTPKNPTVTTQASASVVVGGKISDSATLAGGYNPTGTIHFALYGPDDASCSKAAIFTADVSVNGNGVYGSGDYTTTQAGTYRWIANYGGDLNNNPTSNGCNEANENVVVTKAGPAIATSATPGAQVGDKIHDVATVTGGYNPTGTVTFKLYGPTDPNCDSSPIFTSTVALQANGTATSGDYTVTEQGSFHWVASYSGDANNDAAPGACGDENETTVVNQYSPSITTELHSGNISGAKISVLFGASVFDQATLHDASATAGGTVTYTVYTDSSCTDVYADAGSKTVTNGAVPPSDSVKFDVAGTYYWQASYGGDAANAPATSPCLDEVLTVTTPDLHAVKLVKTNNGAFAPTSTANPGDTLTFQITITNNGDADATNVPVSDDISDVLAHAMFNAGSCAPACAKNGNVLSWTIPTIAKNGGTAVLTFSVTLDAVFPDGITHLPNVVVVTGPGSNCEADSGDADCDTDTTVEAHPDINVLKQVATGQGAFGDTSVANPGDQVHWQISVTNTGNADTTVDVSDDISDILAHASYDGGSCSPACDYAEPVLSWNDLFVPAGGGITLSFSATLDASFPEGTTHLPNVVVVTGSGSNCAAESTDPDCDTDTTVEAGPALNAEKEVAINDGPFNHGGPAQPGDTLHYRITITNSGNAPATNVPVSDNIAALLAHGTYQNDCDPACNTAVPNTLSWIIPSIGANGGSVTLTFSVKLSATFPTGTTDLPNVVVVTGPGSNCEAASEDADCATDNTVTTSAISIVKDVSAVNGHAPIDDPDLHVPGSMVGDTISYHLHYHGEGPINDATITDVIPAGLVYKPGTATSDAKFTFQGYDPATRTLTWTTDLLIGPEDGNSVDGDLSYDVLATEAAAEGPQPLINVATIVGHTPDEEELTDSDTAAVTVLPLPEELTPPPTSTLAPQTGTSNPGFALMLILLGVAGLSLGIGLITPAPASVRRRNQRRR